MPNYRRAFRPGGTFFLTLVTERRAPLFADATARKLLHEAIARCQTFHPFALDAMVLLPDHFHMLMTLTEGDSDFSRRITNLKSGFTRAFLAHGGEEQIVSPSRARQRARGIWQRRFWEHTISNLDDLNRHFDYIHFNAVKHQYVACPHAWPHSSFHRFVSEGRYEQNWSCRCAGLVVPEMTFDDIARSAGE